MAERGEYRSISRSLLSGKDFRRLPERPRWIFTVLKMNSGMVGLDTWYESELHHRLAEESGATLDQVRLALDVLEHEGWIKREDNVVWVVGHLIHDPHLNSSNAKHRKSVQRHVAGLPRLSIVRAFVAANTDWFPKSEAIAMGLEWVSVPIRKAIGRSSSTLRKPTATHSIQEKEKEDEKEKENDTLDSGESNWVAVGVEWWSENVGTITHPRFGNALKPAVQIHGWPRVFAALQCYAEDAKQRGKPAKPEWCAGEIVRWIEWAEMPATDHNGDLTARGRAVLVLGG